MVLKFWTFPDGVVCENLDVRKLLKTLKFQIFSLVKLEVIIDRDSNMGEFTYNVYSNLGGFKKLTVETGEGGGGGGCGSHASVSKEV